ncbi:MAG: BON domain-containing protein [Magnetococcus sp. WYHC-3]
MGRGSMGRVGQAGAMGMLLAALLLGGCVPVVGTGALLGTTVALGERRGPEGFLEDQWVKMKLTSAYIRSDDVSWGNINVSVYQGKVLLTGTAASEKEIQEAVHIARNTRGVTEVASELRVQSIDAAGYADDVIISRKVKLAILGDKRVRGLDFHVEVTKKTVFLTGLAHTIAERDTVIEIARNIQGVAEVVSYIEVDKDTIPVRKPGSEPESKPLEGAYAPP